ncbi:MAG: phospho-sugar mutase [Clostridia bacterium]|nr:phospho-sugar mutase [Clostridia bacterium]MBR3576513.1 phospho-sugar mutase [Clostridia bacterium]
MTYKQSYNLWLSSDAVDEKTKAELEAITNDENEIEDRFYKDLEFGTAGLRGVLGAGTNRMNVYVVKKTTQGLADYIINNFPDGKEMGVAISYDSRINSDVFAREAACVLAANGIKVYLSNRLRPVPELSFAVRHYGCAAGIMITASHNPPKYNGYKVYGADGSQLAPEDADKVLARIEKTDIFEGAKTCSMEDGVASGLITVFGDELDDAYLAEVKKQQLNPEAVKIAADKFKMIYTPLHGSGNIPVRRILDEVGFKNVYLVNEQIEPDGTFPTVKSPNPEERSAFDLAIELAEKEDIDFIFGTDPDCDRIGVVVRKTDGEYIALTGNMVGALLTEYVLSSRKAVNNLPDNGVVIKTVVTSYMSDAICKAYGVEVMNVLTGFKFIGEKIKEFEKTGSHEYLLGFEESYGYLVGTYARDKDAVVASMLIAEMAAFYSLKGMSLYDALMELYEKYGTYRERLMSITLEGIEGVEKIKRIMAGIRNNPPKTVAGHTVNYFTDISARTKTNLATGETASINLPKSNVLLFEMDGEAWCAARPSGTEPKIKFYFGTRADSVEKAEADLDAMLSFIQNLIDTIE